MQTKKRAKPVKFGDKEEVKKTIPSKKPEEADQEVEILEITETITTPTVDLNEAVAAEAKNKENIISEEESKPAEFFSLPPDKYENKKSILPYFILVTFIAFFLGLAFFYGIYYAINLRARNQSPKPTATVTVTPKKETPTPKPIDLSAYTISVLNGTDVPGTAAKLKSQLTDAGFKVGSAGNADKSDYVKTEIASKKNVDKAYLEKLKEILKKSYQLAPTSTLASGTADVVITIGSTSAK